MRLYDTMRQTVTVKKSAFYCEDWREVVKLIKASNAWRCQRCDLQCRRPGEMYLGWEYELSVAHIGQDYGAEWVQLAPLCLRCHFVYDAPHGWLARERHRRQRQRRAGQLQIFDSLI